MFEGQRIIVVSALPGFGRTTALEILIRHLRVAKREPWILLDSDYYFSPRLRRQLARAARLELDTLDFVREVSGPVRENRLRLLEMVVQQEISLLTTETPDVLFGEEQAADLFRQMAGERPIQFVHLCFDGTLDEALTEHMQRIQQRAEGDPDRAAMDERKLKEPGYFRRRSAATMELVAQAAQRGEVDVLSVPTSWSPEDIANALFTLVG